MKIIEVDSTNEKKFAKQIADLEDKVQGIMEKNGQEGQFFTTGENGIKEYAESDANTVMIATDNKDNLIAATYITQGQALFTYNDITKYFKISPEYQKWVKSQYKNEGEYKKSALEGYELKIEAYKNARKRILGEYPEFSNISEFMESEKNSEGSFDEKSVLREKLNQYMYEYVVNKQKERPDALKKYEQFYGLTFSDMKDLIYGKDSKKEITKSPEIKELEENLGIEKEQEKFSKNAKFIVYDTENNSNPSKYYSANPQNSIEIDTYITDPTKRENGIARVIVYEGLKKHINRFFKDPKNKEIFLCSTLHQGNLSSKYVSEFFGLKDNILVNRRKSRDREVHITRIEREKAQEYLKEMAEKLAVLYGFNPNGMKISKKRKEEIIKDQLKYEGEELIRLKNIETKPEEQKKIRGFSKKSYKYFGNIIKQKEAKIKKLNASLENDELTDDEER